MKIININLRTFEVKSHTKGEKVFCGVENRS